MDEVFIFFGILAICILGTIVSAWKYIKTKKRLFLYLAIIFSIGALAILYLINSRTTSFVYGPGPPDRWTK